MTLKHWTLVGGAVACLITNAAHAQHGQTDLAFPGYSGFLNVPSATVLTHGQASVQYSDQAYINTRYAYEDGYHHLHNLAGTFGIFPNVEFGGRLIWDRAHAGRFKEFGGIRDLSANVKLQAPLIPKEWFTLAVGAQDLGGETGDFESFYAVAGRQFGPVEVAVGYGKPEETPRYLDGAFGAVSYRPFPWLNLIAEHDSQDARLGIGVTTPQGWLPYGLQVKGKVLAWDEGDTDNDRNFGSIGLSMPFGNAARKQRLSPLSEVAEVKPAPQPAEAPKANVAAVVETTASTQKQAQADAGKQTAEAIGEQLASAGYDRVRTASDSGTLHIWWENNLYNRDERDSILDVARKAHQAAGTHQQAELTLLNQGLPVLTQTVSLTENEPYQVIRQFAQSTTFSGAEPDWDFEGSFGPSWKPRLTLGPSVSSAVGTEYGVWDASVALSSELAFSLWRGALASARYDVEFYETGGDFEKGGAFYNSRQRTDLIEAEVQQTFKLHPQFYTSFHAGRYAIDYNGAMNEILLLSPGGRHAIGFIGGSFSHTDSNMDDRTQALAQYTYYNPNLGAQFTVYGGQFFAEDNGFRIDSRFWFGDYALTLQYKNTDAEFVSLGWVIPLTPERDHQFRYLQVKGNADWNYAVQTRINEDANTVSFGGAGVVTSSNPLQKTYFNRGRIAQ
ncbi:YjbH domain-containing protein [Cycloclasticus pugetii]|uniref:YjbH domain-containing protein n=1 Tax=Cycloclasticus pugetii TaxID=34068 RepID=UPI003A8DD81E